MDELNPLENYLEIRAKECGDESGKNDEEDKVARFLL